MTFVPPDDATARILLLIWARKSRVFSMARLHAASRVKHENYVNLLQVACDIHDLALDPANA